MNNNNNDNNNNNNINNDNNNNDNDNNNKKARKLKCFMSTAFLLILSTWLVSIILLDFTDSIDLVDFIDFTYLLHLYEIKPNFYYHHLIYVCYCQNKTKNF